MSLIRIRVELENKEVATYQWPAVPRVGEYIVIPRSTDPDEKYDEMCCRVKNVCWFNSYEVGLRRLLGYVRVYVEKDAE